MTDLTATIGRLKQAITPVPHTPMCGHTVLIHTSDVRTVLDSLAAKDARIDALTTGVRTLFNGLVHVGDIALAEQVELRTYAVKLSDKAASLIAEETKP